MSAENILKNLHQLERKALPHIKDNMLLSEVVERSGMKDVEVMRAIQWLENKKLLTTEKDIKEKFDYTEKYYESEKKGGFPEVRFLNSSPNSSSGETKNINQIMKEANLSEDEKKFTLGYLKKENTVNLEKKDDGLNVIRTDEGDNWLSTGSPAQIFFKTYTFPAYIDVFDEKSKKQVFDFEKRGLIEKKKEHEITINLTKLGKELQKHAKDSPETADRLTQSMLRDGSWKNIEFREYDVKINVPRICPGRRHFVNKSTDYMKRIWLDLGFKEMSGNIVQTSFWDLDTLFVPQDHPARQMQDTFYLKEPRTGKLPSIYKKVQQVHENGGDTGSTGWGGKWSKEEASQNMLRTHTTVLSAQFLDKIRQGEYKTPVKFFSVNKVFRNEALDWKHLFEFHQVEGIVIDRNANLKHLKGYLKEFFGKMGFTDVRMRPAHFPYTEPSLEIDVYNPKKKQWVEIGGAGIFRPEVTKTLIGEEIPVLAWGIGMERIIVEYFGFTDLRDLYNNRLDLLRDMKEWMK